MSLMECVAREEHGGELINVTLCDGFFGCASVFSKSVAELSFSLSYLLYLVSGTLYHIHKMSKRCDFEFAIVFSHRHFPIFL